MVVLEWILRWIVVPAKVIPYAMASAQWGYKLPVRRVLRLLWNWQWWLGVTLMALLAILLPSHFFTGLPHGTVSAQIWHVSLKIAVTYLLAVASWVLLLGWVAVLFERIPEPAHSRQAEIFCRNLRGGWRWIAAAFGAIIVVNLPVWPLTVTDGADIVGKIAIGIRIVLLAVVFVFLVFMFRSFLANAEKKTRFYWGILASLVWFGVTFAVASQDDIFPIPLVHWEWGDFVTFVFFVPFVASAVVWGWILPWKRIVALFINPRWLSAGVASFVAQTYLASFITKLVVGPTETNRSPSSLYNNVAMSLGLAFVVLQLAWLAALLNDSPLSVDANTADAKAHAPESAEHTDSEDPLP
jgi:hypothetical protein